MRDPMPRMRSILALSALALAACGGGEMAATPGGDQPAPLGDGNDPATPLADGLPNANGAACTGATQSSAGPGPAQPAPPALKLPAGFKLETLASISNARELAALPNGDLLVATNSQAVYLVPHAESSGVAGAPILFASITDAPVQGITFSGSNCSIYVATQHGIYWIPYSDGQTTATSGMKIAGVRTGPVAPNGDGDVHTTTSVAFAAGALYAGVGSSCNACVEVDPTRATIQRMDAGGLHMATRATRVRNAIALAANPATGTMWMGGAGQDSLPLGHPYEYFDAVSLRPGVADYGWPACEENHVAYQSGANCANVVVPLIELPAYSSLIGATFYPASPTGAHAFASSWRGGLFLSGHGSWHKLNGSFYTPPRVAFVPMNGDTPRTPVNWSNPAAQWSEFVGGFQPTGTTRIARPTGIAVGSQGSLFVGDDLNGRVYRIRPN